MRASTITAWLATASALALATPAYAQATDTASTGDEIVVTARKREERLVDVPQAVTAIEADQLLSTGASRFEDYLATVPGVNFNTSRQGYSTLIFRGIPPTAGAPTVSIYIDEGPFGSSTQFAGSHVLDLDPGDLQQIEVLRGPQGALFGANAVGGVLRYVTRAPDPSGFSGRIEVGGEQTDGNFGAAVRGSVNIPLGDELALRVSGFSRNDPGYIDDRRAPYTAEDFNQTDVNGYRVALGWTPTEDLSFRLSAMNYYAESSGDNSMMVNGATLQPTLGDLQHDKSLPQLSTLDFDIYNFTTNWDIGWASLVYSATRQEQLTTLVGDITPTYGPLLRLITGNPNFGVALGNRVPQTRTAHEIRLTSAEGGRFDWQIGVYLDEEESHFRQVAYGVDVVTQQNIPAPFNLLSSAILNSHYEETSYFGNIDYHFTDRFDVLVGFRHAADDQVYTPTGGGLIIPAGPVFTNLSSAEATTFLVNPRFRINDDNMLYARFASGYQPGAPQIGDWQLLPANAPRQLDPNKLLSYEVGWKGELFDRTLTTETAIYYNDWETVPLGATVCGPTPGGVNVCTNVNANGGAAYSWGVEQAIRWQPNEHLTVSATYSFNESELTAQRGVTAVQSWVGQSLPSAMRHSGSLSADYRWNVGGDWDAIVGGNVVYTGDREPGFASTTNGNAIITPGKPNFTTLGLHANLETDDWRFQIYGQNLTDERGITSIGTQDNGPFIPGFNQPFSIMVIQPRTVGFSIARTF